MWFSTKTNLVAIPNELIIFSQTALLINFFGCCNCLPKL